MTKPKRLKSKETRQKQIEENKLVEKEEPKPIFQEIPVVPSPPEGAILGCPGGIIYPKKIFNGFVLERYLVGCNVIVGKILSPTPAKGVPDTMSFVSSHWDSLPIYTEEK